MGIGLASADRPAIRDRLDMPGTYSASRDGKRLDMLGFNNAGRHLIGENGNSSNNAAAASSSIAPSTTNEREHRDLSGLMGAYGSANQRTGQSGYGQGPASSVGAGRGEGILS